MRQLTACNQDHLVDVEKGSNGSAKLEGSNGSAKLEGYRKWVQWFCQTKRVQCFYQTKRVQCFYQTRINGSTQLKVSCSSTKGVMTCQPQFPKDFVFLSN